MRDGEGRRPSETFCRRGDLRRERIATRERRWGGDGGRRRGGGPA